MYFFGFTRSIFPRKGILNAPGKSKTKGSKISNGTGVSEKGKKVKVQKAKRERSRRVVVEQTVVVVVIVVMVEFS